MHKIAGVALLVVQRTTAALTVVCEQRTKLLRCTASLHPVVLHHIIFTIKQKNEMQSTERCSVADREMLLYLHCYS